MKKIISLLLIASLFTPLTAFAIIAQTEYTQQDPPTAPGGGTLFDSSLGYGPFNNPEEIASGRSDLEVAQQMASDQLKNCSQGQTGGSLSQGLLSGLLGGIAGGLAGGLGGSGGGSGGSNSQCTGGVPPVYKNGDVYLDPLGMKWCYQVCPQGSICEVNNGWNICTNQGLIPTVNSTSTAPTTKTCPQNTSGGGGGGGGGGGVAGLLGGLGGGDVGGMLQQLAKSGLGQKLLGSLGLDPQMSSLIQKALGGDIGGALSGLLGGGGLDSILGGGFSDILGGGGLFGGAGGLFGGAGGLLGGVAGIVGGANVPVIDQKAIEQLVKQLLEQMGIHKDSSTLVHKECDIDPLLRQFSNQISEQTASTQLDHLSTSNAGEPGYAESYLGDRTRRHEATVKAYVDSPQIKAVCQPFQEQIRNILLNEDQVWTTQEGEQRQLACTADDPAAYAAGEYPTNDPLGDIWKNNVTNPQNTQAHAIAIAMSQLSSFDATQQQELEHTKIVGNDFYPEFECVDDKGADIPYQECLDAHTKTPGTTVKDATTYSSTAGARSNENAHEVGEMIDPVFGQLFNKLLNLGIKALSKKSTTGQGSYLDQLSGTSQRSSNASAGGFVATNIATSLAVEKQYQSVKQNLISKLQELIVGYREVSACYANVAKKSPTGITVSEALSKSDTASTTISVALQPQIVQHVADLTKSSDVVEQLVALGTALSQAQTAEDINAISTAYDALSTSGIIHTSADITFLQSDSTVSLFALNNVLAAVNTEITQCRTY